MDEGKHGLRHAYANKHATVTYQYSCCDVMAVRQSGCRRGRSLELAHVVVGTDVGGVCADLLVVLLERREVLARLAELALLHAFPDVPVDERALGVHEVEFVIDAGEDLGDRGGVGDHAHRPLDLRHVAPGDGRRWLVVDAALEARRAPVDELDRALRLDHRDGRVDVLRHDVAAVHQAGRHVLAVARVALGHHRRGLEGGVRDLGDAQLLVMRPLGVHDGGVAREDEVDARVWDKVGLELGDVDVQGAVEAERGRQGGDDLRDEPVQVGVRRALDVEVAAGDVVDGLVVEHDGDVGVLQQGVRREDAVVRLHDGGGDLRRRVDGEPHLRLLAVVHGEALEQQRAEARPGAAADGVEHEETLEAGAVVRELADAVEAEVDDLLPDGVVPARVVVRGVLLARDELLRVEQVLVRAAANLVDDGRLEVEEDGAGHVLAGARLREERVERIVLDGGRAAIPQNAIGPNAVLKAVELPARVADLHAALPEVD